jgi:translation initiation factor 1
MSGDVCSVCGLSADLCMCSTLAREKQIVTISAIKRRFGKLMTVISGIDRKAVDIKGLAKQLKTKLACGGTVKNNNIELQGNQKQAAKKILIASGFAEESIEVIGY